MRQTIAMPVFRNRISSRFDCAESILIVEIHGGTIVRRQEIRWTHAGILERIHILLQEGVGILICGGLTETCGLLLQDDNIEVIPWIRGEIDEVLSRFMQGTLRTTERSSP
jgi:predicted Fe-Mo cluster-binding NifX family protein